MRFGVRLFFAFFILVGLGIMAFLNNAEQQIRPAIRQASEEALVDTANLLAEMAALQFDQGFHDQSPFVMSINSYRERRFNAQIWSLLKTEPDFSIYITDTSGTVIYHTDESEIGADYSRWLDVALTLKGQYGARTTRIDPDDEWTSSMYIAAPIYVRGDMVGVLTVSQPNASVQQFQLLAQSQLRQQGMIILVLALIVGAVLSLWLSHSIAQLLSYVEDLRTGQKTAPPQLREKELQKLAKATHDMHQEIEGKAYVENYIHTLAHEMKSPISAIRGAAEILQSMALNADGQRFLNNISQESHRMQQLIDQLLSLAAVEKQYALEQQQELDIIALIKTCINSKLVASQRKHIEFKFTTDFDRQIIHGDPFLLQQALSNLLDNALDFSPANETIFIVASEDMGDLRIRIQNAGDPVPDYALDQIFDRFYSLPRPDSQRKSTGLGLSFVQEVATLHGGRIHLHNIRPEDGNADAPVTDTSTTDASVTDKSVIEAVLTLPLK